MKRYCIFLTLLINLISCNRSNQNQSVNGSGTFLPDKASPNELTLVYDSVSFEEIRAGYSKLYFSDDKKNIWSLYVKKDDRLNGFYLNDKSKGKLYAGTPFEVTWKTEEFARTNAQGVAMNIIEKLKLKYPDKHLKRRTIKLNTSDNIEEIINSANAGDSIILESGIYMLKDYSYLFLDADHMVLKGEPGVYIFGDIEMNLLFIDGNDITIDNIYLAHTNADDAPCGGDVIVVSESNKLCIRNCDINGCGVTGINFREKIDKHSGEYILENNSIHNNSHCAVYINHTAYYNEQEIPFIITKNNKIWNNGEGKTDEPYHYKVAFSFGLDDSLKNIVEERLINTSISHFDMVPDSLLPFYWQKNNLMLGYLNPTNYISREAKGLLVYERFKPVNFIDIKNMHSIDSVLSGIDKKVLAIYTDSQILEDYYNEGGEDWGYFSSEVYEYFYSKGVEVTYTDSIFSFTQQDSLKTVFPGMSNGMGYLFFYKSSAEYVEHDLVDEVITRGNKFFARIETIE